MSDEEKVEQFLQQQIERAYQDDQQQLLLDLGVTPDMEVIHV